MGNFDGEEMVSFIDLGKFELCANDTKSINQFCRSDLKLSLHPLLCSYQNLLHSSD